LLRKPGAQKKRKRRKEREEKDLLAQLLFLFLLPSKDEKVRHKY